jgi:hypothetical protein
MALGIPSSLRPAYRRLATTFSSSLPPPVRQTAANLAQMALWGLPTFVLFADHVADVMVVEGHSMHPTLNADKDSTTREDWVLNSKMWWWRGLQRGEIVTMW